MPALPCGSGEQRIPENDTQSFRSGQDAISPMSEHKQTEVEADFWLDWLTCRRHGGDPDHEPIMRSEVAAIRDRVLDGARLASGMTLLDIGAGDGLISFEALRRVSQPFSVIFSDISAPLLKRAELIATDLGFRNQCAFIQSSAETLSGIANESVDVITSVPRSPTFRTSFLPPAVLSAFSNRVAGFLSVSRSGRMLRFS